MRFCAGLWVLRRINAKGRRIHFVACWKGAKGLRPACFYCFLFFCVFAPLGFSCFRQRRCARCAVACDSCTDEDSSASLGMTGWRYEEWRSRGRGCVLAFACGV